MPFPYRQDRCVTCHALAVGKDKDGNPRCAYHLPGALQKIDYKALYEEDGNAVIDLIGKAEWDRLFDQNFPGPADMTIKNKDLHDFAHALREKLEAERKQDERHNHMTWEQSQRLMRHHYCSDCWGALHTEKIGEDLYLVRCSTDGCTTPAFISDRSIDYRTRLSDHYFYLARKSVRAALPWLNPFISKAAEQTMLKLLGVR